MGHLVDSSKETRSAKRRRRFPMLEDNHFTERVSVKVRSMLQIVSDSQLARQYGPKMKKPSTQIPPHSIIEGARW